MKMIATCGHTFELHSIPEQVKCAPCGKVVGIWAVNPHSKHRPTLDEQSDPSFSQGATNE